MSMRASDLSAELTLDRLLEGFADAPAVPITGLSADSRTLRPGDVFIACGGGRHHGLEFVDQALAAGASAVVWDSDTAGREPPRVSVPLVAIPGLAARVGELANRCFDRPSERLRVSGVTGTNGKTTVAFLVSQCLRRLDDRCGYIGTLGAGLEPPFEPAGLTTPACADLHRRLAAFRAQGAAYAALEVSSHALHQGRVDGVRFDSALFTNLSRDHIDYHADMRTYGEIKARLFLERDVVHRIVNVDSTFGRELVGRCRSLSGDLVAVSADPHNAFDGGPETRRVLVRSSEPKGTGLTLEVDGSWGRSACHVPLVGDFNAGNAALALAQLLCWDVPFAAALAALAGCEPPPGRLQRVTAGGRGPAVYVDYAHTPAGLEAVLTALRPHCTGNLWCVFGCGGDRDRGKRPLMGAAALRLADRVVVTSDNPRSEDPDAIIAEILAGTDGRAVAIADRARAIRWAVSNARDHDLVLVAGKGHEEVQVIGGERLPFSDCAIARQALSARRAEEHGP